MIRQAISLPYCSNSAVAPSVLRVGDLEMHLLRRRVERAGQRIDLTAKEYALLMLLIAAACVAAFWRAGLGAGGRDNGAPGIRARYHPDYFAAFVLDPDGHNIEAVCHAAE